VALATIRQKEEALSSDLDREIKMIALRIAMNRLTNDDAGVSTFLTLAAHYEKDIREWVFTGNLPYKPLRIAMAHDEQIAKLKGQICRLMKAMNDINDEVNSASHSIREGDSADTVQKTLMKHLHRIEELATYNADDIAVSQEVHSGTR
jgi:hypothetical protein